jgi:hypothetical protein
MQRGDGKMLGGIIMERKEIFAEAERSGGV